MKLFPLTTLIRLYELLKNSRLSQAILASTTKQPFSKAALVLSKGVWWRMTGSNRRPPACKAGALPAELIPRVMDGMVGLVGLEPTTPALSRRCSNQLSYRPKPVAASRPFDLLFVAGDIFQQPISVDV